MNVSQVILKFDKTGNVHINVILTRGPEKSFTMEKHTSTPYSVALVVQHSIRMRRINPYPANVENRVSS